VHENQDRMRTFAGGDAEFAKIERVGAVGEARSGGGDVFVEEIVRRERRGFLLWRGRLREEKREKKS